MRLTVVGCSPAWPNPGSAHSGYLVEADGGVLLDCGPGVFSRLRVSEAWERVDAIAITHLHLDHWGDLVAWAFGATIGPLRGGRAVELWLPPGGLGRLRQIAADLHFGGPLEQVFHLREYAEDAPFEAAGFTLTPFRVAHYDEPTYGLRVADGRRTLAYSADTGPTAALAELARDADLFLCEATLAEPEPAERGHLTAAEAEDAFRASGARRLLLTHRPDELPLADGLERARDGLEVAL